MNYPRLFGTRTAKLELLEPGPREDWRRNFFERSVSLHESIDRSASWNLNKKKKRRKMCVPKRWKNRTFARNSLPHLFTSIDFPDHDSSIYKAHRKGQRSWCASLSIAVNQLIESFTLRPSFFPPSPVSRPLTAKCEKKKLFLYGVSRCFVWPGVVAVLVQSHWSYEKSRSEARRLLRFHWTLTAFKLTNSKKQSGFLSVFRVISREFLKWCFLRV